MADFGRVLRFVTAAAVCLAFAGCGGGSSANVVVVRVGSHPISRATFEHWVRLLAVRDYQLKPHAPVPAWVIPDPPDFSACVGHLRSTGGKVHRGTTPASLQPKRRCAQQYARLREQTLGFLITSESLIGEAQARHITITDAEIKKRFESVALPMYGSRGEFQKYLRYSGETVADQLLRARVNLASSAVEQQVLASGGRSLAGRGHAIVKFDEEFPRRWAARTSCRPGYVVPNCRQYRGSAAPQIIT